MEKFCQKCRKPLEPEQAFCDQCGAAWTEPETVPAASAAPPTAPPALVETRSSKWPIVLIALLALIATGIGAWYFVTKRSLSEARPAASSSAVTAPTAAAVIPVPATPVAAAAVIPPVVETATETTTEAAAGADAATEAAAGSKQCSLITRAEMEAILGSKIVRVTTDGLICSYFTNADRSAQVETTWTGGKEALTAAKGFNEGLLTPVANIGDEAYLHAAGVLHVLKGDTYVVVNSREYANEFENESAIARKIMEKMK